MKKTRDDAEVTRQKILDSAMNVFTRDGYANARLEDIAKEAGVTRGAVYHHFEGKPEVYTALLNERFAEANSVFNNIIASGKSPKELLKTLLVETLILLEDNPEYRKVQELVLFKTAYLPELEEGMQYKIRNTNMTISYLEDIIKKGITDGEFRKDIDAHSAALAAVGLFSGVSTLWLLDNGMFSIKERANAIVDIFINGISAI